MENTEAKGLPSAADLDAVAAEQEQKAAAADTTGDPAATPMADFEKVTSEAAAEFQAVLSDAKQQVRELVMDFAEWVTSAKAAQADAIERLISACSAPAPLAATDAVQPLPAPAEDPAPVTDAEKDHADAVQLLLSKGYSESAAENFVQRHGALRILAEG